MLDPDEVNDLAKNNLMLAFSPNANTSLELADVITLTEEANAWSKANLLRPSPIAPACSEMIGPTKLFRRVVAHVWRMCALSLPHREARRAALQKNWHQ